GSCLISVYLYQVLYLISR
ncbi:tonB dependent receptor family protein, partial [Vibrio parahaemolyticus V-223/04]